MALGRGHKRSQKHGTILGRLFRIFLSLAAALLLTTLFLGIVFFGMALTYEQVSIDRTLSEVTKADTGTQQQGQAGTGSVEQTEQEKTTTATGNKITAELITLGLVPLVVFLIAFDRVGKISLGVFSFEPKGAGETLSKESSSLPLETVDSSELDETVLESTARTTELNVEATILSLRVNSDDPSYHYSDSQLQSYLSSLPEVQYVYFRDDRDRFEGLISTGNFWTLLVAYRPNTSQPDDGDQNRGQDPSETGTLSDRINDGRILKHNLVVRDSLGTELTKRQALERFGRLGYEVLPIVEDGEFIGIARQSAILSEIILPSRRTDRDTASTEDESPRRSTTTSIIRHLSR